MILLILLAAASPCAAASRQSGVAQRQCYALLADQTDREMSAQWKATLAALRRDDADNRRAKLNVPTLTVNLLESQRAWLRYRKAQCAMISDQAAGGTGYGEMDSRCRIQLNRQRTSDLQRRATSFLNPAFP